jgi:co-chaperonin GroES (HSP10)
MRTEQEPFDWQIEGDIVPIRNRVLVCDMEYGETKTKAGLIIPNNDGTASGIKPRWATVQSVGADITDIKPGDRVLIAHGRWTRGVNVLQPDGSRHVVRMVELESILGVVSAEDCK